MHSFNIHNSVRTESKFLKTNSNKAFAKLVWGREVERCSLPKPQVENIKGLVDSLVAKKRWFNICQHCTPKDYSE